MYRERIGCYTQHHSKGAHNNINNHNLMLLELLFGISAGKVFCCFYFYVIYIYVICLLMALFIETTLNKNVLLISKIYPTVKSYSLRDVLNFAILNIIFKFSIPNFYSCNKFNLKNRFASIFHASNNIIVATQYTLWIFALNLILLVICDPIIVNPGPRQHISNVSVAYHNVQVLSLLMTLIILILC